jgi:methylmalonyl-CoA mutase C-terminal domain/subunit
MEVIYAGLRQTPDDIAAIALQEDVDVIGLSMHNGAHLTLMPAVSDALRAQGLSTPVLVGGIVPAVDVEPLHRAGAVAVVGPGASSDDVIAAIKEALRAKDDGALEG